MPSPDASREPAPQRRRSGRGTGRVLLAAVLGFAVLGAAALVFTDDERWLRLGIVAALWAALVGAFAAARYRREAAGGHDRSEELQRVYELELEREVAARREYELQVEADTRRRLEEEVRNEVRGELDGLRTELRTLRQNLEALLGGEVLVERVALRAESTRLRSLSDQSRAARSADRALPQGQSRTGQQWRAADVQDAEVVEPAARQPAAQKQPAWPEHSAEPHRAQPGWAERSGPQRVPAWAERSAPQPVDRGQRPEPAWPERSEPRRVEPTQDPRRHEHVQTQPWRMDDAVAARPESRRAEQPQRRAEQPQRRPEQPQRRVEPAQRRVEQSQPQRRVDAGQSRHAEPAQQPQRTQPWRADDPPRPADPTDILPRYQGPTVQPRPPAPAATHETSQPLDFRPLRRPEPARSEPPMADPIYADPPAGAGWDRYGSRADNGAGNGTGGRRRRADDEPAAADYTGRRRRAPDEDSGSHATGRSVDELIASFGSEAQGGRRRRRDDG